MENVKMIRGKGNEADLAVLDFALADNVATEALMSLLDSVSRPAKGPRDFKAFSFRERYDSDVLREELVRGVSKLGFVGISVQPKSKIPAHERNPPPGTPVTPAVPLLGECGDGKNMPGCSKDECGPA